jgi:hypothetical protein
MARNVTFAGLTATNTSGGFSCTAVSDPYALVAGNLVTITGAYPAALTVTYNSSSIGTSSSWTNSVTYTSGAAGSYTKTQVNQSGSSTSLAGTGSTTITYTLNKNAQVSGSTYLSFSTSPAPTAGGSCSLSYGPSPTIALDYRNSNGTTTWGPTAVPSGTKTMSCYTSRFGGTSLGTSGRLIYTFSDPSPPGSISGYSSGTTYKISATNGSSTFTLTKTDDTAITTVAGDLSTLSPTTTISDSYSLSITGMASIGEGSSVTINLTTTNIPNGTLVPYTITGISAADLVGGSLTGNFTVSNNSASLTLTAKADNLTEGDETMTLTLDGKGVSKSVTIIDTSTTPKALGNFLSFFPM